MIKLTICLICAIVYSVDESKDDVQDFFYGFYLIFVGFSVSSRLTIGVPLYLAVNKRQTGSIDGTEVLESADIHIAHHHADDASVKIVPVKNSAQRLPPFFDWDRVFRWCPRIVATILPDSTNKMAGQCHSFPLSWLSSSLFFAINLNNPRNHKIPVLHIITSW